MDNMLVDRNEFYRGRKILVTGGAGFIGSNLVHCLLALGSRVTVVDSMLRNQGGNLFNLDGVYHRIGLRLVDLRDADALANLVASHEIVFNLAGQVSHEDSMSDPFSDLDVNVKSQVSLLEACRRHNPHVRIVFTSTRQVYGRPLYMPVDENHPTQPVDVNGINKLASEQYHLLYHKVYGLWVSILRLTNTFGPRQLILHGRQGFIAWFLRQALEHRTIQLYGDGQQHRDLTYVDDVVSAVLLAGASNAANGEVFNLGGNPVTLIELARLLCQLCPGVRYETIAFPEDRRKIDIGSYVANWDKIRVALGWSPTVSLGEGLERMVDFYRRFGEHYK